MRTGEYQEGAMNCRAKNVLLTPVIIFLSAWLYTAPNFAPDKGDAPHWSYSGPEGPGHWGDRYYRYPYRFKGYHRVTLAAHA
jgi:carbonic anhydrase